jgi:hypothetical protein
MLVADQTHRGPLAAGQQRFVPVRKGLRLGSTSGSQDTSASAMGALHCGSVEREHACGNVAPVR